MAQMWTSSLVSLGAAPGRCLEVLAEAAGKFREDDGVLELLGNSGIVLVELLSTYPRSHTIFIESEPCGL